MASTLQTSAKYFSKNCKILKSDPEYLQQDRPCS